MTPQEMKLAGRQVRDFFHILHDPNSRGVPLFPKDDALRIAGGALGVIIADIRREAAEKAST